MNLKRKYLDYVAKEKEFCPRVLAKKWDVDIKHVVDAIVDSWDLVRGQYVNGVWVVDFQPPTLYYEICSPIYNRGNVIQRNELWNHCKQNRQEDSHISVYSHDHNWLRDVRKNNRVSGAQGFVSSDYIWIELDRKVDGKAYPNDAKLDGELIVNRFKVTSGVTNDTILFHSGNNSYHVAIPSSVFGTPSGHVQNQAGRRNHIYNLAHLIASDIRYGNGLVYAWDEDYQKVKDYYEFLYGQAGENNQMRQSMENIDPNIYSINSLIRQPLSIHEKGNKPKKIILGDPLFREPSIYPPYFLELTIEAYYTRKKSFLSKKKTTWNSQLVMDVYEELIPEIEEYTANDDGWIDGLYNPFYNDGNPSVAININNGYFYDFGDPTYRLSFVEIYAKLNDIEPKEAYKQLKELEK